jgi:hypothetical protein
MYCLANKGQTSVKSNNIKRKKVSVFLRLFMGIFSGQAAFLFFSFFMYPLLQFFKSNVEEKRKRIFFLKNKILLRGRYILQNKQFSSEKFDKLYFFGANPLTRLQTCPNS